MGSIRAKIFFVIIAFLLVICIAFSFYTVNTTTNYRKLSLDSLTSLLQYKSERINTAIVEMEQDALSLANAARVFYLYTDRSAMIGNAIVYNNIRIFQAAVGGGIWFEPFVFQNKKEHAGFYACYANGEKKRSEPICVNVDYEYHDRLWYQSIKKRLDRRGTVRWSPPYLNPDGAESLLITAGTGIYGEKQQLVGIATIDWKIQNVIDEIAKIKPTTNSFILICDPEHDYILANTSIHGFSGSMAGRSLRNLPWFRNIKQTTGQNVSVTSFRISGVEFYAFTRTLKNGMLISVQVPASELFALINLHNRIFVGVFLIFSLLMLYCALVVVSRFITAPIRNLIREVTRLGQGNLDHKLSESSSDELGLLAKTFNRMSGNLKEYIDRLAKETSSRERITSELEVAAQIQKDLLPNRFPPFPEHLKQFDLYAEMHSAKEVAGDFYDFFMIDRNRIAFVIADVSGKGIPAAMFMMSAKTTLKNNALSGFSVPKIVERTNKALCENNDICMFVSMFFGVYDLSTNVLHYVNCGHNPPMLKREEQPYEWLRIDKGVPLGIAENREFNVRKLRMKKGDKLFCYTDGVTEAMNDQDEVFGEKRLMNIMNQTAYKRTLLRGDLNRVMDNVREFAGTREQSDDVTMLILEIKQ